MPSSLQIFVVVYASIGIAILALAGIFARQARDGLKILVAKQDDAYQHMQDDRLNDAKASLDALVSLVAMSVDKGQEGQIPALVRRLALPEIVALVDEKHPGGSSAFLADRVAAKQRG